MPDQIFVAVGNKFPGFYGTRGFTTPVASTPLYLLFWARRIQTIKSCFISSRFLLFHLCLHLLCYRLIADLPKKKLHRTLEFSGQHSCFLLKRFRFQLPTTDRLPWQKLSRRQNSVKSSGQDSRVNCLFIFSPVKFDDRNLEALAATEFYKIFSGR